MTTERLPPGSTDPAWTGRQSAQASGFDHIGAAYDEAFPHKEGQIACVERMLGYLPAGARVLDAGAGTGLPTARRLVDVECSVTCVDLSPVMLDIARENVPEARFLLGDVLDVPDERNQFEAVTAFFSLLMLPRAGVVDALQLFHRILVPGGWLALAMVEADVDDLSIPFLGTWLRFTGYPREEMRGLLTGTGFEIEHEDVLTYLPESPTTPPEVQLFYLCQRSPAR